MNNLPVVVAALYKFVDLDNLQPLKKSLLNHCLAQGIKGTLLLAKEGINGTIAGTHQGIETIINTILADPRFSHLSLKKSYVDFNPFYRMKVKLKKEIVNMGIPGIKPAQRTGEYIAPKDWNNLIQQEGVTLIDTRNRYETDLGSFKGAIKPDLETFRSFPAYFDQHLDPKQHKRIAMCCTGGIRCEKSTAYLLERGFESVYHLEGGILNYLAEIPVEDSLWQGDCFVFDNRVSVDHQLAKGTYEQCHGCRHPISQADQASEDFIPGVRCPHCIGRRTPAQLQRAFARQHQVQLCHERNTSHFGPQ